MNPVATLAESPPSAVYAPFPLRKLDANTYRCWVESFGADTKQALLLPLSPTICAQTAFENNSTPDPSTPDQRLIQA